MFADDIMIYINRNNAESMVNTLNDEFERFFFLLVLIKLSICVLEVDISLVVLIHLE